MDDFVFVSGSAAGWTGDAEIMFRQGGYCRDSESDRTSSHRPTFARFSPVGGPLDRGAVPERPVTPLLPGIVFVRDTDDDGEPDVRAEPGAASGTAPAPAAGAPAAAPAGASPEPAGAESPEDRDALEERLEALEREAAELRKALEEEGGQNP